MTQAKLQPFCGKYKLKLVVYNVKQKTVVPRLVTQRKFVYTFITFIFVFSVKLTIK